jgi:hypothetical protein
MIAFVGWFLFHVHIAQGMLLLRSHLFACDFGLCNNINNGFDYVVAYPFFVFRFHLLWVKPCSDMTVLLLCWPAFHVKKNSSCFKGCPICLVISRVIELLFPSHPFNFSNSGPGIVQPFFIKMIRTSVSALVFWGVLLALNFALRFPQFFQTNLFGCFDTNRIIPLYITVCIGYPDYVKSTMNL